jgi:hypothetical protein
MLSQSSVFNFAEKYRVRVKRDDCGEFQCACDRRYAVLGVPVIHSVRKSALPSGSLDFAVPTVLLHVCMEVLVVLPARIAPCYVH